MQWVDISPVTPRYYRMISMGVEEEHALGAIRPAPSSFHACGNVNMNVFHSQPLFRPGNMQAQVSKDAHLTEGPDTSCLAAPCPPHSIGESVAVGCDCEPGYSGALGKMKKLHR